MKPVHAKLSIFHRLGCALTMGVLAASQGTIAHAAQSAFLQRELPNSLPMLDHMEPSPQLLALVRYRRRAYRRPRWGAPRWAYGGAARGVGCEGETDSPVVPLVPLDSGPSAQEALDEDSTDNVAFLGLTGKAYPSVLVYIPQTTALAVEFRITDEKRDTPDPGDGETIHKARLALSQTPGIVRFDMAPSETTQALEVNRHYTWRVSLVCNSATLSPSVEGLLQRVPLEDGFDGAVAGLHPQDRINLLAEAGLWHETLAEVADLYCENPNDSSTAADWRFLLNSLNLTNAPDLVGQIQAGSIADAPLLWCENSQEETPEL